jgi:predicted phosphodiesterase
MDERVEAGLELLRSGRCTSVVQAARNANCARATLNEYWLKERHGEPAAAKEIVIDGDLPSSWTPEKLLREHGLDPEEWVIVRVRVNRWDDPNDPKQQLRFDVVPREAILELKPPDPAKWKPPAKPRRKANKDRRKIIVCGDHHAPHHDRTLHKLFLQWLEDERPDEGILLGDLLDFHSISRHRDREGFSQPVNECLQAAFNLLRDYRHASPDTRWTMLRGNHDDRLYFQIIDNARGLHQITAADDEVPALSLRRLLHLDELGIELVDEEWERAKAKITRRFTARHGYTSSKNSTEQMLSKLAHSTVQGHTHRLSVRYRTEHDDTDPEEPTQTRLGAEAGCMCEIGEGLGYCTQPDWQQGALLVHAWADEDFHAEPLIYVPGRLLAPGGKRYAA